MTVRHVALSMSPFAAELIAGPPETGVAIGTGYALFGRRVLAVTRPGSLRMPNGIEADVVLRAGEPVVAGEGELRTATSAVEPGPLWDSRPRPRMTLSVSPRIRVQPELLVGRGPGLTPLGDDVLVGYLAGAALAGRDVRAAAAEVAGQTTALSGTLLGLAAQGRLPEAAHRLLENGDPGPLLGFGATSGKGIALGLGLASEGSTGGLATVVFTLPLPEASTCFELTIAERAAQTEPFLVERPAVHPEGSAVACMSSRR
jgi:hypothetical protein